MAANQPSDFVIDALLCDSAVVADGKLYVQGGGWNVLGSSEFPFVGPRLALAIVVTVPYHRTNQNHTFEVRLDNEDGRTLSIGPPRTGEGPEGVPEPGRIGGQFNIGRPPTLHSGDTQVVPFAVNIDGQAFEAPGAYAFVISIDGTEMERIPFRIVSAVQQTLRPVV